MRRTGGLGSPSMMGGVGQRCARGVASVCSALQLFIAEQLKDRSATEEECRKAREKRSRRIPDVPTSKGGRWAKKEADISSIEASARLWTIRHVARHVGHHRRRHLLLGYRHNLC